MDDKG